VLRSSVFFLFFEVVGIEGFLGFNNAVTGSVTSFQYIS
jgi:hypothetical protein